MAARQRTMPGTVPGDVPGTVPGDVHGTVHGDVHGATTYDPARRRTDRSRGETAAALAARACDCEQTVTVNAENAHLLTLRVPKSPKQPKIKVKTRLGGFDVTVILSSG